MAMQTSVVSAKADVSFVEALRAMQALLSHPPPPLALLVETRVWTSLLPCFA
jgi:hypothetical protein